MPGERLLGRGKTKSRDSEAGASMTGSRHKEAGVGVDLKAQEGESG